MTTTAADWTSWRGGQRDGVIRDYSPPGTWPAELDRVWKIDVGEGHSSPVVAGQSIFQFSRQGDQETITRLNLDGNVVWNKSYQAPYEMHSAARNHGKGPKSTPAVVDGAVYTLGISGIISAWSTADGQKIWQHEFSRVFPKTSPLYGTAMSPLVHDGAVLVHIGGHNRGAFCAFDAKTGERTWAWDHDGPGYTSPIIANLDGSPQIITQSQQACIGLSTAGKALWNIPYKTAYDQNSVTPIVSGDLVVFSGTGRGVTAHRLVNRKPEEAWHSDDVSMYMSSPVVAGNRLYGFSHRNRGQLFALDLRTGKTIWKGPPRQADNAALLLAGDVLLAATTKGELVVCDLNGNSYHERARYRIAEQAVWAHPAATGNRLLVKDARSLAMWKLPSK